MKKFTEIDRSLEIVTNDDLKALHLGSVERLSKFFIYGKGRKWLDRYDIENPIAVALCQGGAMHYVDKKTGINDFDIWFFYPFNQTHLPYRTIWTWDYINPKFGRHPQLPKYSGRRVDVMVRSIRNYLIKNPTETIYQYLQYEKTSSSKELADKAVVMLYPESLSGKAVWYKEKI